MNTRSCWFPLLLVAGVAGVVRGDALLGTTFTYQGRLKQGGSPYNGLAEMEFGLWDAESGGSQVGPTLVFSDVEVAGGLFTLPLDFGETALTGDARWLEITVNGELLSPRQRLTPAPFALALPGLWTQQNEYCPNLIGGNSGNTVTVDVHGATIAGGGRPGELNRVTDNGGTIGGGVSNVAGDDDAGGDVSSASFATVGGGDANTAGQGAATVSGGRDNVASHVYATVGGGFGNQASADQATVGGGGSNEADGDYATVGGGQGNQAIGAWSTVAGGSNNRADGGGLMGNATVGGGGSNEALGVSSTVPGGVLNTAAGARSFAAGCKAKALHDGAFVWADNTYVDFASTGENQFLIRAAGGVGIGTNTPDGTLTVNGQVSCLSGGYKFPDGSVQMTAATGGGGDGWSLTGNAGTTAGTHFVGTTDDVALQFHVNGSRALRLEPDAVSPNVIGGAGANSVDAGIYGATIGGGGETLLPNTVTDAFGVVAGGGGNQAGDADWDPWNAAYSTIAGGKLNAVTAEWGSVGGGESNQVSGMYATVGGGYSNVVSGYGTSATIGGGELNEADAQHATVAGGLANRASGQHATVGGGDGNFATHTAATVGGGKANVAGHQYATVSGGQDNTVLGQHATVPGGYNNTAEGSYSFAAGNQAWAAHQGAFVWADSTAASFKSTAADQFLIRANGGVGIGTDSPSHRLEVSGTVHAEALVSGTEGDPDATLHVRNTDTSTESNAAVWGTRATLSSVATAAAWKSSGVWGDGDSENEMGVYGTCDESVAVGGVTDTGAAVFGQVFNAGGGGTGHAGYFQGRVHADADVPGNEYGPAATFHAVNWSTDSDYANTAVWGTRGTLSEAATHGSWLDSGVWGDGSPGAEFPAIGVLGTCDTVCGVGGVTIDGCAIVGEVVDSGSGYAGWFSDDVYVFSDLDVGGKVSKGGGGFKIDHPLDPESRYLVHSFVESPDMMNVYNGNVVTDGAGYAVVELPDYFAALNRDFRYQLTVIDEADGDGFALAKVVERIENNRFRIRTSAPHVEVSWQVTGIRQDRWAEAHRIVVEPEKEEADRGKYLHPELYGQPKEMQVGRQSSLLARRPDHPADEEESAGGAVPESATPVPSVICGRKGVISDTED